MIRLRIGTFTRPVLLEVAHASGLLDLHGIEIEQIQVASSPAQFRSLREGEYDAVLTSPDNAIAYRYLDANPLGARLPVDVVCAVDRGLGLCLASRPGLTTIDEVREAGRPTLAVDVPTSGFAFAAYALLERLGLPKGAYDVVAVGATPVRATELADGRCDLTILNAGNELRAEAEGCHILGSVEALGPYLGTVLARLADSAERESVHRLADVLIAVTSQILDGRWTAEAVTASCSVLGLAEDDGHRHVRVLRDSATGLVDGGVVDAESIDTLLGLRSGNLPDPALPDAATVLGGLVSERARPGG